MENKYISQSTLHNAMLIGIAGNPGIGKTTFALKFPNPLVLDFDKKLPPGVDIVPFWDGTLCDSLCKRRLPTHGPNRHGALLEWVKKELPNVPPDRTVILDSLTRVSEAFDAWCDENPCWSEKLKARDTRGEWGWKIKYFDKLLSELKAAPCAVLINFHLQAERDKDGNLNGRYRALITGQAGDKINSHLTHLLHLKKIKDPKKANDVVGRRVAMVQPDLYIDAFLPPNWSKDVPYIDLDLDREDQHYADFMALAPKDFLAAPTQ